MPPSPPSPFATVPAIAPGRAAPRRLPVVLIEQAPEPTLFVARYRAEQPLDRRVIELGAAGDPQPWIGKAATVAYPLRLSDGSARWPVLGRGRLAIGRERRADRQVQRLLVLAESWDSVLDRPIPAVGGDPVDGPLGPALARVSAMAGLDLSLDLLPEALAKAAVEDAVDLSQPVGRVLEKLLTPRGLTIQRTITRQGARLIERRAVRPVSRGRAVTLTPGSVLKLKREPPAALARPWVARGGRPVVESTFTLNPDWDPALAHEDEAAYGRFTSANFARYRGVFRRWALNEDARLAAPAAAPLDLTALFGPDPAGGGGATIRPQPLVLGPSVSVDGDGQPIPPVVEGSIDGGATWARWSGPAVIERDHGGVYLDDPALPGDFLAAAKAGTAGVRVTAALTRPRPIARRRWRGNPFAGVGPAVTFDLGRRFAWRRVLPPSIHAIAGLADTAVDDRAKLTRWLIDRLDQADRAGAAGGGEPTAGGEVALTLHRARPLMRVGDRLGDPAMKVAAVACDFLHDTTTLRG